jgi:hypothetical protein
MPTHIPVNVPWDCPDCGEVHPRGCHAHRTVRDDDGNAIGRAPCRKAASTGLTVCTAHGGKTPNARAKSAKARAELAAAREVTRFGRRVQVHPAEALVDLVHWTAGEVAYWREKVAEVEAADGVTGLTWGRTVEVDKRSGEFPGVDVTEEAKPHVAYAMLVDASNRLATYAAAALRAGVDERRVQLAERQGTAIASAIRAILDALQLTPEQWERVPLIVPAQLRLLTSTRQEEPTG